MTTPYRTLWMRGTDAIAHIAQAVGCDESEALNRLKAACQNRLLDPQSVKAEEVLAGSWNLERGLVTPWGARIAIFQSDRFPIEDWEFMRDGVEAVWPLADTSKRKPTASALPAFDSELAASLLAGAKRAGLWADRIPTEAQTAAFLRKHFKGIPNDLHRQARHRLWPQIKRGRPPK